MAAGSAAACKQHCESFWKKIRLDKENRSKTSLEIIAESLRLEKIT